MSEAKTKNKQKTTFWDFLMALGSGMVNLLKIEKIICIVILYLLGRDIYFTVNIDKGAIYRENIIDAASIFKMVVENDSLKDVIYISIIIVLVIIILILIYVIKNVYAKEIKRLSRIRKILIHDMDSNEFTPLKKHHSSER